MIVILIQVGSSFYYVKTDIFVGDTEKTGALKKRAR